MWIAPDDVLLMVIVFITATITIIITIVMMMDWLIDYLEVSSCKKWPRSGWRERLTMGNCCRVVSEDTVSIHKTQLVSAKRVYRKKDNNVAKRRQGVLIPRLSALVSEAYKPHTQESALN